MTITVAEIARELEGQIIGDSTVQLHGFAPAATAQKGDLTFAENELFFSKAEQSSASAILVDKDFSSSQKVIIRVPNARIAFARILPRFLPERNFPGGVHPTAVVSPKAQINPSAHVGPFCVIEEEVRIGAGCILRGHNHLGAGTTLGDEVQLFPNVTLYDRTQIGNRVRIHSGTVIGSDGFGYVPDRGIHLKIPQIGNVIIHDDVEIGANVTVDRGALGPTTIGKGTKIDNLVQIAHNVTIGEHCLIVAQVGIAGSAKIGNYVTIAGQAGIGGHLKIGNQVIVFGQSAVMRDVNDGEKLFGTPAQPDRQMKRQMILSQQLPTLMRRVAELEKWLGRNPLSNPHKKEE